MEDAARERRADPTWAVFAAFAAVYRWGRCPSFGPGDSPVVVYRALFDPGRDPLLWLGRLASLLPFDAPEAQVNALSGLFHAGAAALLFASLRRLGLKRVPALAAAVQVAFLPQFWYYALVAGRTPLAAFGLALFVWSVLAWKDEASPWPLPLGFLGVALAAAYAGRAQSTAPVLQWGLAFLAGLLYQRLETLLPNASWAALAAMLALPLARPYDLRRHNPTLEYCQALLRSVEPNARVYAATETVEYGLRLIALPDLQIVGPGATADLGEARPAYDEAPPFDADKRRWVPKGLLVPRDDASGVDAKELERRAAETLSYDALTSVGRRDVGKYGFTREGFLYDRYRAVLGRYRELLGPARTGLTARLDAQLADYGPGPGAKL